MSTLTIKGQRLELKKMFRKSNKKTYFGFILLKFRPILKNLMDLFLDIALIMPIKSISRELSLKSSAETHRTSARAVSKTAPPEFLKSFDAKLILMSDANSLQVSPSRMDFSTSAGSLLCERLTVRREIA